MHPTSLSRRAYQKRLRLVLLLVGLTALQPALARKDDRQQNMDVTAVHTDGFYNPNSKITLTGSVVATQGTLKATSDKAVLYLDADSQISRIVFTRGSVPAHIQQIDDSGNLMTGDADELDYDNINQIAVLIGHAVVHQQGRGEAHGDKLTYEIQTAHMTGDSNGDGRVHMTFLPKVKPGATVPAGKPAAGAPAAASTATAPAPTVAAPTAPAPSHSAPTPVQEQH